MVKRVLQQGKDFFTKKQEGILSAAVLMMIITLATKATGFLRQFAYAHFFGASRELDMFIAANTFPEIIVNLLIMGSVNAALIPVLFESLEKDGEEKTNELIRTIFTVFSILLLVLSGVSFIFSQSLINWSVNIADPEVAFTPDQIAQMVRLLRMLLISPAILGLSNLITGVLHVNQRFVIPQLAPFLYNLGGLVAIFFLVPFFGVEGVAIGVIIGSVFHLLIQLPLVKYLGIGLRPALDIKNVYLVKIGKLMLPRMIGLAAGQVSLFVDRIIALGLIAGSASAMVFAESIKIIPVSMFGLSIAAAAFPVLSKEAAAGKIDSFKETFVRSVNQIVFFAIPISAILLILRVPIVRLILGLGSGKFTWEDTVTTAWVLLFFSIGLIAESLISIIIKAFYAFQDTRTPVIVSLVTIVFSITTSITLTNVFSHFADFNLSQFLLNPQIIWEWFITRNGEQLPSVGGLALSSSLSVMFEVVILMWLLHKKVIGFKKSGLYTPFLKKMFIGIVVSVVMYFIYSIWNNILNTTRTINILWLTGSTSIAGLSIYVILAYLFNCKEVQILEKGFVITMNLFQNWRKLLKKTLGKTSYIEPVID